MQEIISLQPRGPARTVSHPYRAHDTTHGSGRLPALRRVPGLLHAALPRLVFLPTRPKKPDSNRVPMANSRDEGCIFSDISQSNGALLFLGNERRDRFPSY